MKIIKKIIFLGTPEFAVPTLAKLVEYKLTPILVITQPDKGRGRGQKLSYSPIKKICLQKNIPIFQPENINEKTAIQKIKYLNPDLILTVAYGKIISQKILDIPNHKCINLHPSLLPKYRGPSPINWALFNGDKVTGNSIIYMTKKMDAGDIIYQSKMKILSEDNYGILSEKLSKQGADDVIETISLIDECGIKPISQNENAATFSKFIDKNLRKIFWNQSAEKIVNQIRGLAPYPAAFTNFQARKIKIIKAKLISNFDGNPGQILKIIKNKGIIVGTKSEAILIEIVKPEGKNEMSAFAFSLGHPDIINSKFG
ncbi:MAG: methionyl-tRNA formyltransferase [Candidatus Cloacimonetes bacterium]|nr:methionyl-tRNA formyltransferase [Candidatus Cloacimonadota bacterium]